MPSISYHEALNDALERLDDLGYERGQGVDLANHGPMGAEALALLGQEDAVASWVRRYRRAMEHHEPPAARFALDPADESSWRPALGDFPAPGTGSGSSPANWPRRTGARSSSGGGRA